MLISIITVCLNNKAGFLKTADSITSQDYKGIEWIVIDGGSTDGSCEVIKKYIDRISFYSCEPDQGPYDAMNKGLKIARGDFVVFMNSGDCFFDNDTVSRVVASGLEDSDVIYGDSLADYGSFIVYQTAGATSDLWKGMVCRHQSMFFRTIMIKSTGYDPGYPIGADFVLVYSIFLRQGRFSYIPLPLARYSTDGVSNKKMGKSVQDHFSYIKNLGELTFSQKMYYRRQICFMEMIVIAYKLIPMKIKLQMIRLINKKRLADNSCSQVSFL